MNDICRHCRHASYAHINDECIAHDQHGSCGCVKCEARIRQVRQRTWIVKVGFFEFNKWAPDQELRVRRPRVAERRSRR